MSASLLIACADAGSSGAPPVTDYTQEQRDKVADEIEACLDAVGPENFTETPEWISDYLVLRDQVRAAR